MNSSYRISVPETMSDNLLQSLVELTQACNSHDSSSLYFDIKNRHREKRSDFFCFYDNELVGYLVLIPHYCKGIMNVKGMVHPKHRREGIFTALFNKAKYACICKGYTNMVVVCERNSEAGKAFTLSLGANLKYTNYDMKLDFNHYHYDISNQDDLVFRSAESHDIDCLVALGMQGFGTTEEEERPIIESSMKDSSLDVYVVEYYNMVIGTGTVVRKKEEAVICGLAVDKRFRRKGVGKILLTEILQRTVSKNYKTINLSVDTENLNALTLYQDCGFSAYKTVDFYDLNL